MNYRKKATVKVICSESKGKLNVSIEHTSNLDGDDLIEMTKEERLKYFSEESFLLKNKEVKIQEITAVLKAALEQHFDKDTIGEITLKTLVFGSK